MFNNNCQPLLVSAVFLFLATIEKSGSGTGHKILMANGSYFSLQGLILPFNLLQPRNLKFHTPR